MHTAIVFVSIICHEATIYIYRVLPSLSFHVLFVLSQHAGCLGSFPDGIRQTFIPEACGSSAVLPSLVCYYCPLTCTTGYGNIQYALDCKFRPSCPPCVSWSDFLSITAISTWSCIINYFFLLGSVARRAQNDSVSTSRSVKPLLCPHWIISRDLRPLN